MRAGVVLCLVLFAAPALAEDPPALERVSKIQLWDAAVRFRAKYQECEELRIATSTAAAAVAAASVPQAPLVSDGPLLPPGWIAAIVAGAVLLGFAGGALVVSAGR